MKTKYTKAEQEWRLWDPYKEIREDPKK